MERRFIANLKGMMTVRGIRSNVELAERLNCHRNTIYRWRNGFCRPGKRMLMELCWLLRVKPDQFCLRDDRADA